MTTKKFSFARYGVRSTNLENIKDLVARALGRDFRTRENEYYGVYYTTNKVEDPTIDIKPNWDYSEDVPRWPDHRDFEIMISVYDADDYEAINRVLKADPRIDATLLEHENAFPE